MQPFKIEIAQKWAPFSHTTWFRSLIPRTSCLVEIFPTLLHIDEWEGKSVCKALPLTGPIHNFTVQLDAAHGRLKVFGKAQEGFFSYLLFAEEGGLFVYLEKGDLPFPLKMKERLMEINRWNPHPFAERLSLGVHRKQDWELIVRRADLREIVPFWFAIGSLVPDEQIRDENEGNYTLLDVCKRLVAKKDKIELPQAFLNLFSASFSGLFTPHLNDPRFLGLSPMSDKKLSPLPLFKESAALLRSLFFQESEEVWHLLPVLLPEFHAGRFLHIQTSLGDSVDLEWSKKLLRRAILTPAKTRTIELQLQKGIKTYRLRTGAKDRGQERSRSAPLELQAGTVLYLDRFQK